MNKISMKAWVDFKVNYYQRKIAQNNELRFGQAFMNYFFPDVSDPGVYYTTDDKAAQKTIIANYVKEDYTD